MVDVGKQNQRSAPAELRRDELGVKAPQLLKYWLGKGLSRWADTPHPWTALHAALISEGVPVHEASGLARNIYVKHFGHEPPHHGGKRSTAMNVETRAVSKITEFRDGSDGRPHGLTARAVQYGVRDSYGTSFRQGSFAGALEKRLPPMVWAHDWADPIGRVVSYRDNSDGLDIDVEFDDFEAVPRARQAWTQLRSGTLSQFSFAFTREHDEPDPQLRDTRLVTEVRELPEFSVVLNGAVPGTHTLAVRSQPQSGGQAVDVRSAVDLVTRFAAGKLDLASALAELATTGRRDTPRARYAIRAIDPAAAGTGDDTDPMTILTEVDQAVAALGAQLDQADIAGALRYFRRCTERLSELLYLLGMQPTDDSSTIANYGVPQEQTEQRADVLPAELIGPDAVAERFATLGLRAGAKPYGDVTYADPGYQNDGKKRYPLDTKAHIQAAWSYINQEKNQKAYTSQQLSSIKGKIKAAAKKVGISISEDANA